MTPSYITVWPISVGAENSFYYRSWLGFNINTTVINKMLIFKFSHKLTNFNLDHLMKYEKIKYL